MKGLYPTAADLRQAAVASEGNAAAIVFNGPAQGLDTLGGQVAFQVGAFGLVVVALMSLLMVGRLTRGEEEAGRLELLRSLPIGPHAPTTSAMLAVAGMDVAVGAPGDARPARAGPAGRRLGGVRPLVHAWSDSCSRPSRWSRRR